MISNNNWKLYDWTKITTIASFAKPIDPQLVCFAHSKGVRVVYGGILSGIESIKSIIIEFP